MRTLNRLSSSAVFPKCCSATMGRIYIASHGLWAYKNGAKINFSIPGKPTDKRVRRKLQWAVAG